MVAVANSKLMNSDVTPRIGLSAEE